MPASRSRTENWLDSLHQVYERNGTLELSVARSDEEVDRDRRNGVSDVVWRVRILGIKDNDEGGEGEGGYVLVEPPSAFGQTLMLEKGVALVGAMVIGQNRWMFHTRVTGFQARGERVMIELALPERVERCTRRKFYRISTAELNLPRVQCWSLIDPSSVRAAEAANRGYIESLRAGEGSPNAAGDDESLVLPSVGPGFAASLINVSGGGLGLMVPPEEAGSMVDRPFWWVRIDLRPEVPAAVAVTTRVAHTRIDSAQNRYVGLAFDFSHNPEHRQFVVGVFAGYLRQLQEMQAEHQRKAG